MNQNNKWILIKRGYYFRPNAQGYTSLKSNAGLFSEEDVSLHVIQSSENTAKKFELVDEFSPAHEIVERKGDFTYTFTGKKFWALDPRSEDVDIIDIAHALSHACRYAGHCKQFYSVAEHCVLMAQKAKAHKMWALLHDASEAYICDIPSPIKPFLSNYKEIEYGIMNAVCIKFNIEKEMPPEVKELDSRILQDEAIQCFDHDLFQKTDKVPLDVVIKFMPPLEAKKAFIDVFNKLT